MPQQPQWIKDLKNNKISYSVVGYRPSTIQQPAQSMTPPMTIAAGAGPDGVVQTNKTSMVDYGTTPPSKYHEGEKITIAGNGVRTITPAQQRAMGNFVPPTTIQQQYQMDQMQLPGYADGGVTVPDELTNTSQDMSSQTTPAATGSTAVTPAADITGATNTGSALSTIAKDAVSTGLGLATKTATGNNPYLQTLGSKQLTDQAGANAASGAASMMSARRSGASTPVLTTISQEIDRTNENAQNDLRSNIYSKQQEAALSAASNLVNQGQQVRQYEDVTLPTTAQTLKNNEQVFKSNEAAAAEAARSSVYNLVKERNKAGVWGGSLVGDQQVRDKVKSMMGSSATDADVEREIGIIESALLDENRNVYNVKLDDTIGDMLDNNYTLDQVLNDSTLLKDAAGYLRINDLSSPEKIAEAKQEIISRFNELGKSDSQRYYDALSNEMKTTYPDWFSEEGKAVNPNFEKDLKQTIGDLQNKGAIKIENGKAVVSDYAFDWPWEDPDTKFNYYDFNGNELYGGMYDAKTAAAPVTITGNGTKYKNGSGLAVNQADVKAVWDKVGTMAGMDSKEDYFNTDGSFKMDKFLKDAGFAQNTGGDYTLTTPDEFEEKIVNDSDYAKSLNTNLTAWSSISNTTPLSINANGAVVAKTETELASAKSASELGKYVYYDEFGAQKTGDLIGGELGYIWEQFSKAAGLPDGELLNSTAFAKKWNNGDGWRVNSKTGKVENLWDKDATGTANAALNNVASQTVNSNGTITWGENNDSYKSIKATTDNVKAIIDNKLYENPAYSQYFSTKDTSGKQYWVEENPTYYRDNDNAGNDKDRWAIDNTLKAQIEKNVGKYYTSSDGKLYVIMGYNDDAKTRDSTASIRLWDVVSQKEVLYSSGDSSQAKNRIFV